MLVFPSDSVFNLVMEGKIEVPFKMDFIQNADNTGGKVEHSEDYLYMGRFYIGLVGNETIDKCNMYVETTCSGYGSYRTWRMVLGMECEVVTDVEY